MRMLADWVQDQGNGARTSSLAPSMHGLRASPRTANPWYVSG